MGLVRSQRSDLQTLRIPTGDHKEQKWQLHPSYDMLWTSTKLQKTKSTCRKFVGTREGETRTNQGQNPTKLERYGKAEYKEARWLRSKRMLKLETPAKTKLILSHKCAVNPKQHVKEQENDHQRRVEWSDSIWGGTFLKECRVLEGSPPSKP